MNKRFITLLLAGLLSAGAWAADTTTDKDVGAPAGQEAGRPLVVGQPYSATHTLTMRRTQPNGGEATHATVTKLYRDSEGRTRRDLLDSDGDPTHSFITGTDGMVVALDHRNRTYRRDGARRGTLARQVSAQVTRSEGAKPPVVQLGERDIEGVPVTGQRTTYRIKTRTDSFDIVTESWMSKELGLALLVRNSDPKGESVLAVSDLDRAEPDPALFVPPEAYQYKP